MDTPLKPDPEIPQTPLRSPYRRGAMAVLPMIVGTILFGLATGAATASSGIPDLVLFSIPAIYFAGVAQLAYAQLFALGAPFASILMTLALINLRYLIYATIVSTWERPRSRLLRILAPYFITETSFALSLNQAPHERIRFMLGVGTMLWLSWVLSSVAGALLASQLPPLKHGYAIPAIVLAPILMPLIKGRHRVAVAVIAFVLGLVLVNLPYRLGPLFAGTGAVAIAMLAGPLLARRR